MINRPNGSTWHLPDDRVIWNANTQATNVGLIERIVSAVAGVSLFLFALRRAPLATILMILGGSLLYRSLTGYCPVYGALGLNRAQDAVAAAPATPTEPAPVEDDKYVELSSEDSFPASDPPAWISGRTPDADSAREVGG